MEMWIVFTIIIVGLLVYDLGFVGNKSEAMSFKHAIYLSVFYSVIACLFGIFVFFNMGVDKAREYYTCFFIEKAMSLDNIFIILMIFQFFAVPLRYQHRILFLGILGVIVFRAIIIYLGVIIISKFSWLLYILAIILVITGIKTFYIVNKKFDVQESYIYKMLQKYCNLTTEISGNKFFINTSKGIFITPLFASLIIIEVMDIIFAIDSIPAIIAITNDPYIIYTSNIFAILGLRALFLCLANIIKQFSYVKYSLALILILIGIKIFVEHFIDIPSYMTLAMTITLLLLGIIISIQCKPHLSD